MIRFPLQKNPRKLKGVIIGSGSGPSERIEYLKQLVTGLIRHERVEGREDRIDEVRGYAEELINLAVLHGDRHKHTMEMADAWLLEKDLVHKLFKVLAPRYENYSTSFTKVYRLPAKYPGTGRYQALLELKGNPYPPVLPQQKDKSCLLTNVMLSAARKDFYQEKERLRLPKSRSKVNRRNETEVDPKGSEIEESVISEQSEETLNRTDKASDKNPIT